MSRAHHKKIGRPDRWSSGRCERGHDVTLPDAVRVDGTARICVACRREKQREWARIRAASQRPTGPLFDRCVVCGGMKKAKSRRAVKTCGPKCLAELNRTSSHRAQLPRERQPNAVEMDKILELRARAETEPTWKRVQTITLAESIREHGLPSDYRSRRTPRRALSRTDCIAILASEDETLVRFKTGTFDLDDPYYTDFTVPVVAAALERLRAKHEIAADVVADEDFAWDVSFEASEVYARYLAANAEDY